MGLRGPWCKGGEKAAAALAPKPVPAAAGRLLTGVPLLLLSLSLLLLLLLSLSLSLPPALATARTLMGEVAAEAHLRAGLLRRLPAPPTSARAAALALWEMYKGPSRGEGPILEAAVAAAAPWAASAAAEGASSACAMLHTSLASSASSPLLCCCCCCCCCRGARKVSSTDVSADCTRGSGAEAAAAGLGADAVVGAAEGGWGLLAARSLACKVEK